MVPLHYAGPDTGNTTTSASTTTTTTTVRRMKRSRAYDDLVALAEEAEAARGDACGALLGGWEPFPARLGRCKRSRGAMAGGVADEDAFPAARHSLQFAMELPDAGLGCSGGLGGARSTASSSTGSLSSAVDGEDDDDVLPLRRNSRERILLRQQQKKQQRRRRPQQDREIEGDDDIDSTGGGGCFGGVGLGEVEDALLNTPETPENRVLRAGYAQCIDPLDKRQGPSTSSSSSSSPSLATSAAGFDVSAFVLLAISPRR